MNTMNAEAHCPITTRLVHAHKPHAVNCLCHERVLLLSCARGCVWVLQRDVALTEITKAVKRPPVPAEAYSLRATLHYNSGHYV